MPFTQIFPHSNYQGVNAPIIQRDIGSLVRGFAYEFKEHLRTSSNIRSHCEKSIYTDIGIVPLSTPVLLRARSRKCSELNKKSLQCHLLSSLGLPDSFLTIIGTIEMGGLSIKRYLSPYLHVRNSLSSPKLRQLHCSLALVLPHQQNPLMVSSWTWI